MADAWQLHGPGQSDYFDVLRAAREKVAMPADSAGSTPIARSSPDDAEAAFLQANPGLPRRWHRRHLRQALSARGAHLHDQGSGLPRLRRSRPPLLPLDKVVMPPVRGG